MRKFMLDWAHRNPVNEHRLTFQIQDPADNLALTTLYLHHPELESYQVNKITRTTEKNFQMRLHRDNYHVQKNPEVTGRPTFTFEQHNPKDPEFAMVLYYSTYNQDFRGGVFQFADGTQIRPKRGMCSFFSTQDLHEVTLQTSGERTITLFTFTKI